MVVCRCNTVHSVSVNFLCYYFLYRDLAVELPFMLTHPKPEESEPPTSSRDNEAQDGTGELFFCKLGIHGQYFCSKESSKIMLDKFLYQSMKSKHYGVVTTLSPAVFSTLYAIFRIGANIADSIVRIIAPVAF